MEIEEVSPLKRLAVSHEEASEFWLTTSRYRNSLEIVSAKRRDTFVIDNMEETKNIKI